MQLQRFSKMNPVFPSEPCLSGVEWGLERSRLVELNVPVSRTFALRALFTVASAPCFKFLSFPRRWLCGPLWIHCARHPDLLLLSRVKWLFLALG